MLKKAAISIIILGAAGVGGYWLYNQQSGPGAQLSAARLVPPETLFFIEAPDLAGSARRWPQTGLAGIGAEPEVKAFLEKPLARLRGEAPALGALREIDARQGFVAITHIDDNNMPYGVLGLSYAGPRERVATLIDQARKAAQNASPQGKSELTKYKTYEIESFSSGGVTMAGAFAGDKWYFVANSVDLLKQTLDRFETPGDEGRLAGETAFRQSTAALPRQAEALGYAQPQFFYDKIIALSKAGGNAPSELQVAEMKKVKGMGAAISFDGPLIREILFTYAPEMTRQPDLGRFSLGLTSPDTLLFVGTTLPRREILDATLASNPGIKPLEEMLSKQGLSIADVTAALGSEFGIYGSWPIGAMMPAIAFATEIKDQAKARTAIDALPDAWSTSVKDDVVYKTMPPLPFSIPISLAPSMALTDKALIGSFDRASVEALVAKAKTGGETLESTMAYKEALATVGKANNQLAYVDVKTIFERFYGTMRPLVQLSGGFIPGVADVVDLGKLPTTEAVSKHLRPTIFVSRYTNDGAIFESTGTLSMQGSVLATAVASGVAVAANIGKLEAQAASPGPQGDKDQEETAPAPTPEAAPEATPEEAAPAQE